MLYRWATGE